MKRTVLVSVLVPLAGILVWAGIDLYSPLSIDFGRFDPDRMADLETQMWRSYYEKDPAGLRTHLLTVLREENKLPFLRAQLCAYHAARAAFVFKHGQKRTDYEEALPHLVDYYEILCRSARTPCRPERVANLELEWWIAHRERYGISALADSVAAATSAFYGIKHSDVLAFGEKRSLAMDTRDVQGAKGTVDWNLVQTQLRDAYGSLSKATR